MPSALGPPRRFRIFSATIREHCAHRVPLSETGMRALILALAGGLGLAASEARLIGGPALPYLALINYLIRQTKIRYLIDSIPK